MPPLVLNAVLLYTKEFFIYTFLESYIAKAAF